MNYIMVFADAFSIGYVYFFHLFTLIYFATVSPKLKLTLLQKEYKE